MSGDAASPDITEIHPQELPQSVLTVKEDPETGETIVRYSGGEKKVKFAKIDPDNPLDAIAQNLYITANDLLPLALNNSKLVDAWRNYTRPGASNPDMEKDEMVTIMKKGLEDYARLSKENPEFQQIMQLLRDHLPETFYVYRGQVGSFPHRQIENYTINPEHTYDFIRNWSKMNDEFHQGSMIVRKEINRDQIIAIGANFQGEVIVDNGPVAPAQPLKMAA